MDYPLARLGSREFEHLLQSLCKARLGSKVEAFGDGPDGGRDAVIRGKVSWSPDDQSEDDVWDGYTVMQAKFRQRPLGTDLDTKWFIEQVEDELKSWAAHKAGGTREMPDYLFFTTNVVLAGASGGGIEKVKALIGRYAPRLGLKGWRVWHYDEICQELTAAQPGVRAAFGLTTPAEVAREIGGLVAERLAELQKTVAGCSELLDGFPGLADLDRVTVPAFDRALAAALEVHHEACASSDADDPWLLPAFEETVLRHMLGALRDIYVGPSGSADVMTPAERLLLHVIPLYIDAVLRLEHSSRLAALRNPNHDSGHRVARADLERAFAEAPTVTARLGSASRASRADSVGGGAGDQAERDTDALRRWLAHRATLRSPSVWDDQAAKLLAETIAACLEERGGSPRQELADLIRRIGRHAAYDASDFDDAPRALRLPGCPQPLQVRPPTVAWLSRFLWQAALDPRATGRRVVEHVGMRTEFNLDQAVSELRAAQWMATDMGIDIDAVCSHPATAHALIEHARHVDDEIRRLRQTARMPVFGRLRADEQGVRARTEHGVSLFQLPLTELGMSQDEVRRLLMGTALYGRPELAVREMYQNAMDACRRRAMRRRYLRATTGSAAGYQGEVTIRQRMQENGQVCVECVDNGSGMSRDELRNAFAQAGRRFTDLASFQDEQATWLTSDLDLRLYPNSRFGIGVFSYFMLASEIVVETVPENADGKLGDPLSVLVSAPSGLLTITRCRTAPAEIANGGTIIRLYLDGGSPADQLSEPGEVGEGLSVLSLLEELIAITEVHLTVEEDGHEPREWRSWEFGLPTMGPVRLAFETDGCRGWWTLSDGAVLVDGIKTNVTLPGLLVDLRGPHAPSIRADRNQLLDWDQAWVIDQFIAAADTVVDWEEATLVWLWQISFLWPRLGQRLFNVLCGRRPEITVGIRQEPRTRADLRVVGAMPYYEIINYIHGPRLRTPFLPVPSIMRAWLDSEQADELGPMPWWPDELWAWEQKAWEPKRVDLGYLGLSAKLFGVSAIESIDGYPVPDPIDAALMCEPPDHRSRENRDGLVRVIGFLAGASRSGITPHEACRRIRRFAVSGLHFPSVDARNLTQAIPDPMLLDMLVRVISLEIGWMSGSSRVGYWLRAAMIATYELRRPLADAKALFEYISKVGFAEVPELSDMAHERIPTYAEMQLFCQGGTGTFEFIQKLRAVGRDRANEFLKIAEHYEPLLADYGLTLGSLRAGYDDDFVEIERAARYDASDIQAPDRFSALAEALRLRGSGYRVPQPTNYVEFSALAKTAGVGVTEAVRWINSLQKPPILVPDLDWDSLRSFELNLLQRLILRRDSSSSSGDIALSVSEINFSLLISRAVELNKSLPDIALAVRSMECIGIRIAFSDPVPDVAPDERDVSIVDALCKDGISCLLRLLSSRGESSRVDPLPPIARIAILVRWVCSTDERLPAVIDALQEFNEDLIGGFSPFTESIISSISNAAQNGNPGSADLIGIAGWAGISIATLRLTVAPFDRLLAAVGVAPTWFPDPTGTPPDWLDVALVDLLDAWPEMLGGWTEEIADFLVANVMADQATIKERYDLWHDILVADPTRSDAARSGG